MDLHFWVNGSFKLSYFSNFPGLHPDPHHSRVLALPIPDLVLLQWVHTQATPLSTALSAEAALGKISQFTTISWFAMLICCNDFQNIQNITFIIDWLLLFAVTKNFTFHCLDRNPSLPHPPRPPQHKGTLIRTKLSSLLVHWKGKYTLMLSKHICYLKLY